MCGIKIAVVFLGDVWYHLCGAFEGHWQAHNGSVDSRRIGTPIFHKVKVYISPVPYIFVCLMFWYILLHSNINTLWHVIQNYSDFLKIHSENKDKVSRLCHLLFMLETQFSIQNDLWCIKGIVHPNMSSSSSCSKPMYLYTFSKECPSVCFSKFLKIFSLYLTEKIKYTFIFPTW